MMASGKKKWGSFVPLSQLMNSGNPMFINKISDQLFDIVKLLTCPNCDKFLQGPVGLKQCNHRFCEECVMLRREQNQTDCSICKGNSKQENFRRQPQLINYIINFKKLINDIAKKTNAPFISELRDCVFDRTQFSELGNSGNLNENSLLSVSSSTNVSGKIENLNFSSNVCPTKVEPKIQQFKSAKDVKAMILADKTNAVDQNVKETLIINKVTNIKNADIPKFNTSIEVAENSGNLGNIPLSSETESDMDKTIIDSQEEILMDDFELDSLSLPTNGIDIPNIISELDSNPTQSQYHVLKPTITYAHKSEDDFDRILKNTENTSEPNKDESTKFKKAKTEHNSSSRTNRSSSPELYDLSDFSEDSLLGF